MKRPNLTIHPQAIDALRQYDWPGNVRELANVIERAVVLASDDAIAVDDLTLDAEDINGLPTETLMLLPFHESVEHFKRMRLQEAIAKAGGSKTKAAQDLDSSQPICRDCASKWESHDTCTFHSELDGHYSVTESQADPSGMK
ncbi:MAG TPA: hypothetical protein VJL88_10420 [Nitrospira sp.]|nr:hypothetical protein [Nitrospira sp.]